MRCYNAAMRFHWGFFGGLLVGFVARCMVIPAGADVTVTIAAPAVGAAVGILGGLLIDQAANDRRNDR
jgi:hypothetical protein